MGPEKWAGGIRGSADEVGGDVGGPERDGEWWREGWRGGAA